MRSRLILVTFSFTLVLGAWNVQANSRKLAKPTSVSSNVVANSSSTKSIPELISYAELRAMNKIQREKYLIQLQNLLITISDSSSWETVGLERGHKWQNWIEQLLETAEARSLTSQHKAMMSGKCPAGMEWNRNGRAYGCVAKKSCPLGTTLVQVAEDGLSCQTTAIGGNCPNGFLPQTDANTKTTYCLPSSAMEEQKIPSPLPQQASSDEPAKPKAMDEKKDNNPLSQEDRKVLSDMLIHPEKTDPKYLPKPVAEVKDGPTESTRGLETPEQVRGEETGNPAPKCWWEEMQKCETSTKKRKAIAKEWYKSKPKDGELACIYAGNVSGYKNPAKPKPGECKPTTEAAFGGKTFKCSEGQSLCSPLVFGVKDFGKGEGFCSKGNNATQDCAKKGSVAGAVGLIQGLGPSASFEWDRLKDGLKKLVASCILEDKEKNSVTINSKAFQCQECQVIATRVAEMRASLNSKLSELSCELTATGSVAEVAGSSSGGASDTLPAPQQKSRR